MRFSYRALAKRTCYRALVREWRTFQKCILWFLQVRLAIFDKGLLAMRFSPIPFRKKWFRCFRNIDPMVSRKQESWNLGISLMVNDSASQNGCLAFYMYVTCLLFLFCNLSSCRVLSCLVVLCRVLFCLVLFCRNLSCLVLSCRVLFYLALFCLVLSCPVLFVLSCHVWSCFVLSGRVVSCLGLSCLVLSV